MELPLVQLPAVSPTTPLTQVLPLLETHPAVLVLRDRRVLGLVTPESVCLHVAAELNVLDSPGFGWGALLPSHLADTVKDAAADQALVRSPVVRPDTPVPHLVRLLSHGPVVVAEGERVVGVLTARALLRALGGEGT